MRPSRIFGHSEYIGREVVIDSVHDDRDARAGSSDATIQVEAKNFVTIARHGSTTQARFARKTNHYH
ncbi:hypothetical protein J1N35_007226 [Gossypium stocksii]|uniref:Uncharacterized protein n=1 Tax=Gossypium stocksii TaxID=47602 RepID=A0A9D4AFC8_9ROSI|nr:hypothetical protein J1N35_007226 [Gossypium stocksii]